MRHKTESVVYAVGWLESQFEVWKAQAADESAQKTFAQAEELFKTISEGTIDLIKELAEAQRQLASIRALVKTSAEQQIDAIRFALG